jgi:hypothetical protein
VNTDEILAKLRETGACVLEPLSVAELGDLNSYLFSRPIFADCHVPQTARNEGRGMIARADAAASECLCVHTDDAILAPHLLERGLATIDVAAKYLGREPPVGYSMNVFYTRPGPAAIRGDIQGFHRDSDDDRFLGMFVYLSDVTDDAGGPQDLEGPDGVVRTMYGAAGTVFLADTSRSHRGRKPTATERGIAWMRWGVSDHPPANVWDKIVPISAARLGARYPSNPRLREAIKLLAV